MPSNSIRSMFWTDSTLLKIFITIAASLLIAISAQISIPLLPVPVTLQTFAVFGIALTLGSRMAVSAVILYLAEGLSGLPVFAHIPAAFGPTSGYLIGYIFAAWIVGRLVETGCCRSRFSIAGAIIAGNIALYVPGVIVLASYIGWQHAWQYGVAPFYLVCFAKLVVLTVITPYFWSNDKETNL